MDFSKLNTYPIKQRKHKVTLDTLCSLPQDGSFAAFYDALPNVLGAEGLRTVARAVARSHAAGGEVMLAMGAHPIKCGLAPIIIDMMERGIITGVALNGAGIIHDFEMAYIGETSEDVAATLQDGTFGMVEETGRILNEAINEGVESSLGVGQAVGRHIAEAGYDNADISILAAGHRLGIDVTSHIAIGTDTIHVHPAADGAALGEATYLDFKRFTGHIAKLEGGVYINLGSAVLLPEVFLKALSAVRNMGYEALHFTTVNMDMTRHYRPSENVLKRPSMTGGTAVHLTGMHEIMLPLVAQAVRVEIERYNDGDERGA